MGLVFAILYNVNVKVYCVSSKYCYQIRWMSKYGACFQFFTRLCTMTWKQSPVKKTYQFTIYYVALSFITKGWYVIETLRRNKVHGMWKRKLFIEMIFGYFSKNCLRQKPLTTSTWVLITWVLIGCDEHSHCMAVTFTFSLKEKAKSHS